MVSREVYFRNEGENHSHFANIFENCRRGIPSPRHLRGNEVVDSFLRDPGTCEPRGLGWRKVIVRELGNTPRDRESELLDMSLEGYGKAACRGLSETPTLDKTLEEFLIVLKYPDNSGIGLDGFGFPW
jgi:hypothetical protein